MMAHCGATKTVPPPSPAMTITTMSLPDGVMNVAYTTTTDGTGKVSMISDLSSITNPQPDQTSTDTLTVAANGSLMTASHGSQVVGIVIDANDLLIANDLTSPYPTISLLGFTIPAV